MKTKPAIAAALESSLIRQVRLRNRISRVELARALDVAPSTVGVYVDRLIRDGFLQEGSRSHGLPGRPATALELNPTAGQFVGVDFEARQLSAVAVDFSHQVIRREERSIRASDNADTVTAKIKEAILAVRAPRRPLLGVGVAVPGVVDQQRGLALHYEFIRDWRNVPLVQLIESRFNAPTYLENNIRAMALAERWFGSCQAVDDFICVGVRSGIGAGVMIEGRLYRGTNNLAGEIGGWRSENAAGAGNLPATLEQRASVQAILRQVSTAIAHGRSSTSRKHSGRPLQLPDLLHGAHAGDEIILTALRQAAGQLGEVISQMSLLLNPQQVVIAGPLASLGEIFLAPIRDNVARLAPPLHAHPPDIVASPLGDFGGALGAAAMALHEFQPNR